MAILDLDFFGYTTSRAAGDLPASVTARQLLRWGRCIATNTDHGAAVAEDRPRWHRPPSSIWSASVISGDLFAGGGRSNCRRGARDQPLGGLVQHRKRRIGSNGADPPGGNAGIVFVNSAGNFARTTGVGPSPTSPPTASTTSPPRRRAPTPSRSFPGARSRSSLKWDDWPIALRERLRPVPLPRRRRRRRLIPVAASEGSTVRKPVSDRELQYTNLTGSIQALARIRLQVHRRRRTEMDLFIIDDGQSGFTLQFAEEAPQPPR